MGLLDTYLDPETMAEIQQLGQPTEEQRRQARNNALMQMGLSMMVNNGGANKNQAFMNALGNGGMAGLGSYNDAMSQAKEQNMQPLQTALAIKRLQKENLPNGMTMGQDGKPTWIPGYLEGQQQMHQSQQQPYFQFLPTANGYAIGDARKGTISMPDSPVMRASDDPRLQGQIASEKERGKTLAEAQATAEVQLPSYIGQAQETLKQIDELRKHPGFDTAVGKSSMFQIQKIPGTDAYSFMNRLDQLKGGAFLQAFNGLKGGGQITEIEGKKATDAIARMDNAASEGEFKSALNDYESVVRAGIDRATAKASGSNMPGQVQYPKNAGMPGVKVPDGAEQRSALLGAEMKNEQSKLAQAKASGDLKGISEANRNIDLLNKEMGKKSSIQPKPEQKTEQKAQKQITRTGTYNGRKVVQYSDGSIDYAD